MFKGKKGLTLIELLAVIAIIAILFVLLIPQINSAIDKARVAGIQTDLHDYEVAITSYLMENPDKNHTEESINKYLDADLKFSQGVSKEKNAYGNPYELNFLNNNKFYVSSKDKSTTPKYLNLVFENVDGQYVSEVINEEIDGDFCGLTPTDPIENFILSTNDSGVTTVVDYIGDGDSNNDIVFPCSKDGVVISGLGTGTIASGGRIYNELSNMVFNKVVIPHTYNHISKYSFHTTTIGTIEYYNRDLETFFNDGKPHNTTLVYKGH